MPRHMDRSVPAPPIELPPGWQAKPVQGKMVFVNHKTKRTQWGHPVTGAKMTTQREHPVKGAKTTPGGMAATDRVKAKHHAKKTPPSSGVGVTAPSKAHPHPPKPPSGMAVAGTAVPTKVKQPHAKKTPRPSGVAGEVPTKATPYAKEPPSPGMAAPAVPAKAEPCAFEPPSPADMEEVAATAVPIKSKPYANKPPPSGMGATFPAKAEPYAFEPPSPAYIEEVAVTAVPIKAEPYARQPPPPSGMAVAVTAGPIDAKRHAEKNNSAENAVALLYLGGDCEKPDPEESGRRIVAAEESPFPLAVGRCEGQASSSAGGTVAASDSSLDKRASSRTVDGRARSVHFGGHIWAPSTDIYEHDRGGGGGKASLPPGWSAHADKQGDVYYANLAYNITTWTRPGAPEVPPSTATARPGRNNSSGVPPDNGEPPLPPGWRSRTTTAGDVYYLNYADKTTTWIRPVASNAALPAPPPQAGVPALPTASRQRASSAAVIVKPALPAGWRACTTETGEVYYLNHVDRSTSWIRPVTPRASNASVPPSMTPSSQAVVTTQSATSRARSARDSAAPGDADAQLPAGWSSCRTAAGETYYINHVDETTTWTRPMAAANAALLPPPPPPPTRVIATCASCQQRSTALVEVESSLPAGWSSCTTRTGDVYYINHYEKSTTWVRPEPVHAERRSMSPRPRGRPPVRASSHRQQERAAGVDAKPLLLEGWSHPAKREEVYRLDEADKCTTLVRTGVEPSPIVVKRAISQHHRTRSSSSPQDWAAGRERNPPPAASGNPNTAHLMGKDRAPPLHEEHTPLLRLREPPPPFDAEAHLHRKWAAAAAAAAAAATRRRAPPPAYYKGGNANANVAAPPVEPRSAPPAYQPRRPTNGGNKQQRHHGGNSSYSPPPMLVAKGSPQGNALVRSIGSLSRQAKQSLGSTMLFGTLFGDGEITGPDMLGIRTPCMDNACLPLKSGPYDGGACKVEKIKKKGNNNRKGSWSDLPMKLLNMGGEAGSDSDPDEERGDFAAINPTNVHGIRPMYERGPWKEEPKDAPE